MIIVVCLDASDILSGMPSFSFSLGLQFTLKKRIRKFPNWQRWKVSLTYEDFISLGLLRTLRGAIHT